jgi:hypothetical protein
MIAVWRMRKMKIKGVSRQLNLRSQHHTVEVHRGRTWERRQSLEKKLAAAFAQEESKD